MPTKKKEPQVSVEVKEVKEEENVKIAPLPVPQNATEYWEKQMKMTKEKMDKLPKVKFYVPLEPGEAKDSCEIVQINGYRWTIKKGHMVEVPEPVAKILAELYKVNIEAGSQHEINRSDEVADALS